VSISSDKYDVVAVGKEIAYRGQNNTVVFCHAVETERSCFILWFPF